MREIELSHPPTPPLFLSCPGLGSMWLLRISPPLRCDQTSLVPSHPTHSHGKDILYFLHDLFEVWDHVHCILGVGKDT